MASKLNKAAESYKTTGKELDDLLAQEMAKRTKFEKGLAEQKRSDLKEEQEREEMNELIKGLSQIGMGAMSMQSLQDKGSHGLDFSQTKLPETSRQRQMDRIQQQYQDELARSKGGFETAKEGIAAKRRTAEQKFGLERELAQADKAEEIQDQQMRQWEQEHALDIKRTQSQLATQAKTRAQLQGVMDLDDPTSEASAKARATFAEYTGKPVPDSMQGSTAVHLLKKFTERTSSGLTGPGATNRDLSPDLKKMLEGYGKAVAEDITSNKIAKIGMNQKKYQDAIKVLDENKDSILLNPGGDAFLWANKDLKAAFDDVRSVQAESLKQILGGAFAQKEGEMVLNFAADPSVGYSNVRRRFQRMNDFLRDTLRKKVELKQQLANERDAFKRAQIIQNSGLKETYTAEDIFPELKDQGRAAEAPAETRRQKLERLRKLKRGE